MNYIGSKYSLMHFLVTSINSVINKKTNMVFADLFAGTGVVGAEYRSRGFNVISNDIQYYSYVLNKHYITNNITISSDLIEYLNNLKGVEGFVYNNYCAGSGSGRNYFSDENGKKCDAIRIELDSLLRKNEIDESSYYSLLASLLNSIDKVANTASVYGAFLKHIKSSAQKPLVLELLPQINGVVGKVYNMNINELIYHIDGDVLYLDPPYNTRQYSANYHVLETIARYDYPELFGKSGLRDYSQQKSAYCSKRTVEDVFDDLVKNAKFKYIFVSYNNEGLMSLDIIKKIMEKYGKYTCFTQEYRRFKADKDINRNISSSTTIEYLHLLEKVS
ncbi:MAG: DNA adenine methylase [Mucispirillum sp.]|nr:DNA adenine methylase [Mucispirillum sp.]